MGRSGGIGALQGAGEGLACGERRHQGTHEDVAGAVGADQSDRQRRQDHRRLASSLRAARPVTFPSRRGTGVTLRGDVPEEVRGRFEASLTEALGALGESVAPVVAVTGGDEIPPAARIAKVEV